MQLTAKPTPYTNATYKYSWHTNPADTISAQHAYRIAVVGIGEIGNRLIASLSKTGLTGAKFIRLQSRPSNVRARLLDSRKPIEDVKRRLSEFDVIFLAAGLTAWEKRGSARAVVKDIRPNGSIIVGVTIVPLGLESRYAKVENEIRSHCDTALILETGKLQCIIPDQSENEADRAVESITTNTLRGIIEAIAAPSLISYDWSDFKMIMKRGGIANIGIGESDAPNRVQEAVRNALTSPSLSLEHLEPAGALVHVTGDDHMTVEEANRVGEIITETMGPNTTVIWGARISPEQERRLKVTLIVTRKESRKPQKILERTAPQLFNLDPDSQQENPINLDFRLYQMENL